jgi:uracil-DNA glycosylase
MDARTLRELELDGVVRLYAPLAAPAEPAATPPRCLAATFVAGLDWLVAAGGEEGAPFTAAETKLLDAMLAAAGGARTPEGFEGLDAAITSHRARLLVVLGHEAALELLGEPGPLAGMRGRLHHCRELPAIVTFHPAELLEAPKMKAQAWEDLVFARRNTSRA